MATSASKETENHYSRFQHHSVSVKLQDLVDQQDMLQKSNMLYIQWYYGLNGITDWVSEWVVLNWNDRSLLVLAKLKQSRLSTWNVFNHLFQVLHKL